MILARVLVINNWLKTEGLVFRRAVVLAERNESAVGGAALRRWTLICRRSCTQFRKKSGKMEEEEISTSTAERKKLTALWSQLTEEDKPIARKKLPQRTFVVKVRNRPLADPASVYDCNAWDDVKWDSELEENARQLISNNSETFVDPEKRESLEKEAHTNWDKFYTCHQNKFFRDRNWLLYEFPELQGPFGLNTSDVLETILQSKRDNEPYPGSESKFKVLEIGCGVGNTVFPLLDANRHPETYMYCSDFSNTAVDIIKSHEKFQAQRCCPFVLDMTAESPQTPFPKESIDVITSIFVISAIAPEKFPTVIKNIYSFLKPGGVILFRDYGRYDMAQLRFNKGRCLSENFYFRGDGTRVYFFTKEELETMFTSQGFEKEYLHVDNRLQVNRSRQLKMYRVWIQAKFKKPTKSLSDDVS